MNAPIPGDAANVSVSVAVPPDLAFEIFTEEIDQWWRRGSKYRVAGRNRGIIRLEPEVGGRLFESFDTDAGPRVVETGRVLVWQPPSRLVFEWRASNFAAGEKTEVEVVFTPSGDGTLVRVQHRGFASLRPDHPVRHGQPVPAFIRAMGLWWGELMTSLREHATARTPPA
ncbi:SRPBCC domain-containing protein [Nannocystis sp. SCPEA4]|uniref:SRPBCC domain-containing protein n=1 Tax=Nannocystis sp. SCPEA4 TaxID=2996787 RepID=UPI002270E039|nr:SRPBCC domain-containing protein [Nannocystis sp. SCPEA4]MCY1054602.1 SRPBCC domain-containing protein [Nannocystis sp. SCPEA4]